MGTLGASIGSGQDSIQLNKAGLLPQPGSESTAGDPSALPLDVVMQPEVRLAGRLRGSLFQLPEEQG